MKRPWNIPQLPVYSLATTGEKGLNMNICTYVSAVSMQPKLYAIAVYHHTQTWENLQHTPSAVLQLLSADQFRLVAHLGKKSGKQIDKHHWLHQKNRLTRWKKYLVLPNCSALVALHTQEVIETGDHSLYIFEVQQYYSSQLPYLTTGLLSEKKLIRI
jgi:flavin reductase (DIM6/NTAB) family NADH-FMN oxidoreductase RutF